MFFTSYVASISHHPIEISLRKKICFICSIEQSTCNYSFHQVAAGLVPLMSHPPTPNIFESDSEEEQDPVSDSDSDFDPRDEIDDASEDENQQELYPLRTNVRR